MSKKITVAVVVCILVVTVIIIMYFLKSGGSAPVVSNENGIKQNVQTKTETVKPASGDASAIVDDLNSINDEDFGDSNLSDSSFGL